jgi:hypothetical protein
MTGGRSRPCRSFTKAHAVSELTFSDSQMLLPNSSFTAFLMLDPPLGGDVTLFV